MTNDKHRPLCVDCGVLTVRPDTPTSMRERLARAAAKGEVLQAWEDVDPHVKGYWLDMVDAILAELAEPGRPTIDAAASAISVMHDRDRAHPFRVARSVIGATIRHIRDGGS
ncbi:MAG: hypothetical protein ACR2RF_06150 [Geminicoccaceae bacterium]